MGDILAVYDLRVEVRILVVTDGAINLWDVPDEPPPRSGNVGFTLREMARALWDAPAAQYPYTRFVVDHAVHGKGPFTQISRKETDPETGRSRSWTQYDNFRFDEPKVRLHLYDQVWVFGYWPGNPNQDGSTFSTPPNRMPLEAAELRKLAAWMNAGGGVFATGDHGLLGMHLAGDIPRVRKMRHWFDLGLSDTVPSNDELDRIDTIVPVRTVNGHLTVSFDDQSDNVPKRLSLKWYALWDGLLSASHDKSFIRINAPHPLLCSPLGAINILPDHMHEGLVREESEITLTGDDQTGAPEFPGGRRRPTPEVIAWARVRGGDVVYDDLGPLVGSTSVRRRVVPAVSVYDGQRAGIGRVVVDPTWHNFLDINVRGTGAVSASTGLLGRNLELVHYYVRNIAQWLASPDTREAMRSGFFLHAIASTGGWSELIHDHLLLGERASDVLGRVASQCESTDLVFGLWWDSLRRANAGACVTTRGLALPSSEHVSNRILGAMTEAVFDIMPDLERLSLSSDGDEGKFGCAVPALVKRLREARLAGIHRLTADWRESLCATGAFLDAIDDAASESLGARAAYGAASSSGDAPYD